MSGADGAEHLLLRDGVGRLRIDVFAGTALAGPIIPRITLEVPEAIAPLLLTIRRLHGLSRSGCMPQQLFRRERRAPRWTTMLRVLDGLYAGASQRDIAAAIYGRDRVAADWRGVSDHLRASVRRLISGARCMVDQG